MVSGEGYGMVNNNNTVYFLGKPARCKTCKSNTNSDNIQAVREPEGSTTANQPQKANKKKRKTEEEPVLPISEEQQPDDELLQQSTEEHMDSSQGAPQAVPEGSATANQSQKAYNKKRKTFEEEEPLPISEEQPDDELLQPTEEHMDSSLEPAPQAAPEGSTTKQPQKTNKKKRKVDDEEVEAPSEQNTLEKEGLVVIRSDEENPRQRPGKRPKRVTIYRNIFEFVQSVYPKQIPKKKNFTIKQCFICTNTAEYEPSGGFVSCQTKQCPAAEIYKITRKTNLWNVHNPRSLHRVSNYKAGCQAKKAGERNCTGTILFSISKLQEEGEESERLEVKFVDHTKKHATYCPAGNAIEKIKENITAEKNSNFYNHNFAKGPFTDTNIPPNDGQGEEQQEQQQEQQINESELRELTTLRELEDNLRKDMEEYNKKIEASDSVTELKELWRQLYAIYYSDDN
jgi:hypothetical protein